VTVPALPPVANVLRVETEFYVGSNTTVFTRLFFRYSGSAPSNGDCAALAATIRAAAVSHLVPVLANANGLENVTVQDLSSLSGGVGTATGSTPGTLGTDANPAGVAVLANYGIQRRYRGGKPRSYWPIGDRGALVSPNAWSASAVSSFTGAITGYTGAIVGLVQGGTTIGGQVNVSYYSGFTSVQNPVTHRWRNVPTLRAVPAVDAIATTTVNVKPGNQRRRYQR
jgi:hypothetical protein